MYYRYVAYADDKKLTRGVQVADSEDIAARILAGNGFKVLSLKPAPTFLSSGKPISRYLRKVPSTALISFSRQFALLHESGTDTVTILEMMKNHISNQVLKKVLENIIKDVNKGSSLSDAMSKHPGVFPRVYLQSIKLGEQSGNLEGVLRQMADYLEKEVKSSKSIQGALRYPIIVGIVAIIVVGVLVTYALPTFVTLYTSLKVELPPIVRFVISAADWATAYGLYVLGAIVLLGLGIYAWSRSAEGKLQVDTLMLKIPVLGNVYHLNELSRCCRNIAVLYKSGLQIPDILLMVIDSANNGLVKNSLTKVYKNVVKGEGLSGPMSKDPVFQDLMVQMVSVGETTGNLDKTMLATAETYESEASEKMSSFIGYIQPTITVVIGVVVAFVAVSLISAMYSMYGQI
jgi:type IV pilus assembly protein PilC